MVDGNKLNSVLEFTYLGFSEALYQLMDALTIKYRAGWLKLVHLRVNYARGSGTTTMSPCMLKATVKPCCPSSYTEPRPGECTYR